MPDHISSAQRGRTNAWVVSPYSNRSEAQGARGEGCSHDGPTWLHLSKPRSVLASQGRSLWRGEATAQGEGIYFRRRTPRSLHRRPTTSRRQAPLERSGGPLTPETPIITVKEARKLWGVGARTYTDDEVQALIRDYEILARRAVRAYLVR